MRLLLLLLLAAALPAAPLASVPTGVEAERVEEEDGEEKEPVPVTTSWGEFHPGHQPAPGPAPQHDDAGEERPELPPALYARRLAAAPRPPAPPTHPPPEELSAGHLDLPPPTA